MPDWISTPEQLNDRLRQRPARIGLDTEFIRERTYWPRLALVQLAIDGDILLVDALAPGIPAALAPILADGSVLKVMHSASEDLVALKYTCGVLPAPLFDTQIAAALAGVGAGIGYQKLVQETIGIALPKGETRSDWMRRPLSDTQLEYAADDVEYLFALHDALDGRLEAQGRREWLAEDCRRFIENAARDEGDAWPHLALRSAQFLEADAQARLLRLLRWRDATARASDKPRTWILDNELAVALAKQPPGDRAALQQRLETHPKAPLKLGDALWQALNQPLDDETGMPLAHAASDGEKARLKQAQDIVARHSAALGLADGVLASRRHLEALLENGQWPGALSGWRRRQLEPLLAPLLTGAG